MIEAWKIGIRVSVLDYASIGLRAISGALLRTEGDAAKLEKRLASIKGQFLTGGLMIGAGVAMAAAFKPAVEAAITLEQAMNRLRALNLGATPTNQLMDKAREISRTVKGTSLTEAMKLAAETQGVTANTGHTLELLPGLARMKFGIETYMAGQGHGEGMGEQASSQFQAVVKAMEMRGLMRNFTADKAQGLEDLFTRAFVASGGQVKPSDFLAMMKTSGVAGKQLSPDFMLAMGHIMQEMGGSRSGTALMSAYNNWQNGRTTQMAGEELARLGLVKADHIKYSTTGKMTGIKPDALKDSDTFMSNPLDYMNKVLLPAMKLHGINTEDQRSVLAEISTLFSNRTAGALFSQMYMDRAQLGNYMTQTRGVMGVDALYAQGDGSTRGNLADMQAKFNTLLATLGMSVLPLVNSTLEKLIPLVQNATDWMAKHAKATKLIVDSLLGLAALSVVGGTINIIVASVRGLALVTGPLTSFVGGVLARLPGFLTILGDALMFVGRALLLNPIGLTITAIAAAVYLLYRNWSTVGPYVMKVWNIIKAVFHMDMENILTIVTAVWNAVKPFAILIEHAFLSVFDTVTTAIGAFVASVTSILAKLWDWLANSKLGKAVGWVADETSKAGHWIGTEAGKAWSATNRWADAENAQWDAAHGNYKYQVAGADKTINTQVNVLMDGKKVGQGMVKYVAGPLSQPYSANSLDPSLAQPVNNIR